MPLTPPFSATPKPEEPQLVFAIGLISTQLMSSHAALAAIPDATYRSAAAFDAATSAGQLVENFDGFGVGQSISSLFADRLTFPNPVPTVFNGFWGRMLLPQPTFASSPLVMDFSTPVFGVGANAFDDIDGSPAISRITLRAITPDGDTLVVAEDFNDVGDTGFLGVTTCAGIARAVFSIDSSSSNFEIDGLKIGDTFPRDCVVPTMPSTWGRIKSMYR